MNQYAKIPEITLHNGVSMPKLGLGVWKAEDGSQVYNAVHYAIDAGYRLIDTAAIYQNESGVGSALHDSTVPRDELFITTKVWNSDQGYDQTLAAFDTSMQKLQLDYLDLYLIHWPKTEQMQQTWKALEHLYQTGKVRAIGVCNFEQVHLEQLMLEATIKPMVNQIELHPLLSQVPLREYCMKHQIHIEAWSPLGQGTLLDHSTLLQIGQNHQKSAAQVILRWNIQHGIITIPKSVNQKRIIENISIFDFELTSEEMHLIDQLNTDGRIGPHPEQIDF